MNILHKRIKNRILLLTFCVGIIVCAISVIKYNYNYNQITDKLNSSDIEVSVFCKVSSFPNTKNGKTSFCAKIKECDDKAFIGEGVYVTVKDFKDKIQKGDYVSFNATLKLAEDASNEGEFDYRNYLKSLDVSSVCYPMEDAVKVTKKSSLFREIYEKRLEFITNCEKYIFKSGAGFVSAVLTGDRQMLSGEVSYCLKTAGIYHIVAISGLHLNLFILAICDTIKKSKMKRKKKALLSFIACMAIGIFVIVFTGFGISVIRAFIMMLIMFSGLIMPRESDSKNSLFLTGFIVVTFMPYTVYSVSWWLSFLSTLGVIDGVRFLEKISEKKFVSRLSSSYVGQTFIISAFTSLYTLPVTSYVFGYLPLFSFIANALVLPVMSILIALGVVFAFSSFFLPKIITIALGFALTAMGEYITFVAKTVSDFPFAIVTTYHDTLWRLLFLVVCAICLFNLIRKRKYIRMGVTMLCFMVAASAFLVYNSIDREMKITFADASQGDCTLLEINGYDIMIDCGTQSDPKYTISSIDAFLRAKNIRKLDALFITHYHTDHTNGAIELLKMGKAKKLVLPLYYDLREPKARETKEKLIKMAIKSCTEIQYVSEGSKVDVGDDATFEILSPNEEMFFENNDMSLVMKITYGKTKALLLGDTEEDAQRTFKDKDIDCDILKLAHHGDYCDAANSTIEKASPMVAIASCGKYNYYGHPDKRVLEILDGLDCKVLRTDKNGAVTVRANKEAKLKITTMR